MPKPIITLLTDFGTRDYFVPAMKGVILNICPEATIVDITHEVSPFAISEAAFTLAQSSSYFPYGTIHIVVVDPGVGSSRRPIVVEAGGHIFVGPDNGVFSLISAGGATIRVLSNAEFHLPGVSQTFHGRDIFAPVGAHLANGTPPDRLGELITDAMVASFASPAQVTEQEWHGGVVHVDHFGNIVTNFDQERFSWVKSGSFECRIGGHAINTCLGRFSEAVDSEPFAIFGSAGLLELSLNQASLAAAWQTPVHTLIQLFRVDVPQS